MRPSSASRWWSAARWRVLGAAACVIVLMGSEVAEIVHEYGEWKAHTVEAVANHLVVWDAAVDGFFASTIAGLRAVSIAAHVTQAEDLPSHAKEFNDWLDHLGRSGTVHATWLVMDGNGHILSSAGISPVSLQAPERAALLAAAQAAGPNGPPVYSITTQPAKTLNVGARLRRVDGAVVGLVVAQIPYARLDELVKRHGAEAGVALMLRDGNQGLVDHSSAPTLSAADLTRMALAAQRRDSASNELGLQLEVGDGMRYLLRGRERADWGLYTAVAMNTDQFLAQYREEWILRGLFLLALAGLLAFIAMQHRHQRRQLESSRTQANQLRKGSVQLLELLPEPTWLASADGTRARFNSAFATFFGLDADQGGAVPWQWDRVIDEPVQGAWRQLIKRVQRTGQTQWRRVSLQASGGRRRSVLVRVAALRDPLFGTGERVTVVILHLGRDELNPNEDAARARELLQMAEAEQWRLGQALHDELGQQLTGIAFLANVLDRKLRAADRSEADDAQWLTTLANETIEKARQLARGLVPVNSAEPGALASALGELCRRTSDLFNIVCGVQADPGFDPGGTERANHLYRIVQELITNAVRHGTARKVSINLIEAGTGGLQRMRVSSDGVRIGAGALGAGRGLGLAGIRTRVAYLGATISFNALEEGGLVVVVDLPPVAAQRFGDEPELIPPAAPPEPALADNVHRLPRKHDEKSGKATTTRER
jgi:signal transduction histidine kinase